MHVESPPILLKNDCRAKFNGLYAFLEYNVKTFANPLLLEFGVLLQNYISKIVNAGQLTLKSVTDFVERFHSVIFELIGILDSNNAYIFLSEQFFPLRIYSFRLII